MKVITKTTRLGYEQTEIRYIYNYAEAQKELTLRKAYLKDEIEKGITSVSFEW